MYPSTQLWPVRGLAKATVVFLVANLLAETLAAVAHYQRITLIDAAFDVALDDLSDLEDIDFEAIADNELLVMLADLGVNATFVLAGIMFVVWLYRVRDNAEQMSTLPQRRATPWLFFGWFVPIVSFWFPKQIVDDIWRASDPRGRRPGVLMMIWWILWLVTVFLGNASARVAYSDEENAMAIRVGSLLDVATYPLVVVCGVLAVVIVRRISALQEAGAALPAEAPADV
ncbi:DUF4328 domain-containing protein [Herbidospora sp. NEAU-GS84]|uniref:DUF4328 domain-containing protein n=1 Tax=Herbidospora solisilvae TaxID=2696284 RepID=A0A7C9J766_9ACTN|nr:DUF4328 domain-containing protein [Herbidospora solisilvae]NAS25680.1 DUF4328 domain-containing protein [Herbidospora solisilvae]